VKSVVNKSEENIKFNVFIGNQTNESHDSRVHDTIISLSKIVTIDHVICESLNITELSE